MKMQSSFRKIFITIYSLAAVALSASAQDNFSVRITYISGQGNNIIVEVTVTSDNKDVLESLACKSVVNAYLFNGIEGVGTGKPVMTEEDRDDNEQFFKEMFRTRYTVFANNPKRVIKPKKTDELYTAVYRVAFHGETLEKDLQKSNILDRGESVQSLPTIMVVPFKRTSQTYSDVIDNDRFMRFAIHKVEEELKKKGYSTIDYVAAFDEAKRRGELNDGNEDSFVNQMISSAGADVKIIVSLYTESKYNQNTARVTLKAVYCSDGTISANATKSYSDNIALGQCITGAVHQLMKDFRPYDMWPRINGKISLNIGIAEGSTISMDTQLDKNKSNPTNLILSEVLDVWVRRNSSSWHKKGLSDVSIIFDNITLKKKDDLSAFARSLRQYISSLSAEDVKLKASYRLDGTALYFTISESDE